VEPLLKYVKVPKARPSRAFLVIWRPSGGSNQQVKAAMRVVHAFSSTKSLSQVRRAFESQKKTAWLKSHGPGQLFLVEQGPAFLIG
jgi:ABC-type molybdate transport system substrate-binding protein